MGFSILKSLQITLSMFASITTSLSPNAIALIADAVYSPIPGNPKSIFLSFGILPPSLSFNSFAHFKRFLARA